MCKYNFIFRVFTILFVLPAVSGCGGNREFSAQKQLDLCIDKIRNLKPTPPDSNYIFPRSLTAGSSSVRYTDYHDWTSGFWPGILWYSVASSKDTLLEKQARAYGRSLFPLVDSAAIDHDLGFQVYCGLGMAYKLTSDSTYRTVMLRAADTLSRLFNPVTGTILSWPRAVKGTDWPARHNTIMDNIINLELLFWAARNGGSKSHYDIAVRHAETTMKNQFRADYGAYHVVLYDTTTGARVKGMTHQGYADSSMWARGQSWAIYGYTMVYRETKNPVFLEFAQAVTDVYLNRLPDDQIPYWDFDDPAIPNAPKDASAACVVASALLELAGFINDEEKADMYIRKAERMLDTLSGPSYMAGKEIPFLLLHSTGHKPNNSEVDASINYADYYYLEALYRLTQHRKKERL